MAITHLVTRIDNIANRLEKKKQQYEKAKDLRAVFTFSYEIITRRIASEFPEVYWNDPEWLVNLLEAFARRYLDALDAYDKDRTVPSAWSHVFQAIGEPQTTVLEALIFAMSAHIIRDLPEALVEVGLLDTQQESRIKDFHRVNDLLENAINLIQHEVTARYNPLLRQLDYYVRDGDEILTNYGIRLSRGMAWYNAWRMHNPHLTAEVTASLDRSVIKIINDIRQSPIWLMRVIFRLTRLIINRFQHWPVQPE